MRVRFGILVALAITLTVKMPAAESLSQPSRSITLPGSLADTALPVWSRGYLLDLGSGDGSVTVYTTADQPQVAFQAKVWPDGASVVHLTNAAAAPSGTAFAVSGTALSTSGASTGFLSFFGPGRTLLFVQLPNTGPMRVVFADDETLWVLVRQRDSSFNELGEYNMLRHYDANGKFLGSAVPRSGFPNARKCPIYTPSLSASHDTIGVYFDRSGTWMELAYDGTVKGQWQVPQVQPGQQQTVVLARLDLTVSNQVVRVSMLSGKAASDHLTQLEILQKSGAGLSSSPVDFSVMAPVHPNIVGVDGNLLVWVADSNQLTWCGIH